MFVNGMRQCALSGRTLETPATDAAAGVDEATTEGTAVAPEGLGATDAERVAVPDAAAEPLGCAPAFSSPVPRNIGSTTIAALTAIAMTPITAAALIELRGFRSGDR